MRKINDRDMNFVLNAVLLALIIMAVMHAIAPIVAPPPDRTKEVQAYLKELVPLRPRALEHMLHRKDGDDYSRGSLLVVYAAWCPYCRKLMPEAISLLKGEAMRGIQPIFLALDKKPADLSKYIVNNGYVGLYTPYIIEPGASDELIGVLSMTDSHFKGHIPYVGFFNAQGKLVAETLGLVDKERLLAELRKLNGKP